MLEINHAMPINYNVLPETIDAVHHFEACGGHLMLFSPFGLDPLSARPDLSTQRERVFLIIILHLHRFFTISLTVTHHYSAQIFSYSFM